MPANPPRSPALAPALALALLTGPLAGCLSGDSGPTGSTGSSDTDAGIEIPHPAPGSWYAYTSTNTERAHNITVGPVETRTDAWLRERPARLMDITHYSPHFDVEFRLEAAIDPWTGLVVSHWADCGSKDPDHEDGCLDDRAGWYGSAHGLPGAAGAAPFWGQTLEPQTVNRTLPTILGPLDSWHIKLTTPSFSQAMAKDCLEVEPVEEPPMDWALALQFTGGLQSFTLCQGLAMPLEYESHEGNTYHLEDHHTQPGHAPNQTKPKLSPSPEPPVNLVERTPPVLIDTPEIDPFFRATEAHEVALEQSDPYADLFDTPTQAAVFEADYDYAGSHRSGHLPTSTDSETWSQTLTAINEHGHLAKIEIEKTEGQTTTGNDETTYEIIEESTDSLTGPVPTIDTWANHQADVAEAITLGEQLTNRPSDQSMGYWKLRTLQTDTWLPAEWPTRLEGPSLQLWFEEETPCGGSESLAIACPHDMVVDGPTGAIHHINAPGDALDENLR